MFQKEIHMIYLVRKVLHKSRKDQNPKVEIIDLKCLFRFQNFIKEDLWFSHLEEDRFVENAKDQEMKVVFCIHVKLVMDLEK